MRILMIIAVLVLSTCNAEVLVSDDGKLKIDTTKAISFYLYNKGKTTSTKLNTESYKNIRDLLDKVFCIKSVDIPENTGAVLFVTLEAEE